MDQEYLQPDWGKFWTYLVVSLVWMSITGFIWYLVEERRDNNARVFYEISRENFEQLENIRAFTWADSSNCMDRTAVKAMLRNIQIIRTRREVDSINALADTIPFVNWQKQDGNFYPHSNAAKPYGSSTTDGWSSIGGGVISLTGRSTVGSSGIEVDPVGPGSGARTSFAADPNHLYDVSLDVRSAGPNTPYLEIYADGVYVMKEEISTDFQEFEATSIKNALEITIQVVWGAEISAGNEAYIDNIIVTEYKPQN